MNDDIEELKAMIEPLKDWKFWKYSCTDEDVKKAMENKSYIEVVLEEQSKTIKELQQELQRKDNEIKQLQEDIVNHIKITSEYKEQMIRKDNNWNELKEWLNEPQITYNFDATEFGIEKIECVSVKDTLDKIKELECKDE